MIYGNCDSTASRMLDLVARHCPRLMREGGGPLGRDYECKPPTATTPELIARIRALAAEKPRQIAEIADLAGIGANHARSIMLRYGIRRTAPAPKRVRA